MNSSDKKSKISIVALVLCAGSGTRTGLEYNKMLHYVGKKTILEMTIDRINASRVSQIMLAVSPKDEDAVRQIIKNYKNISICYGGNTRTESVRLGLFAIGQCDIVCIHDGARPYINASIINKSIDSAINYGSGIVAVATTDTIKEVKDTDVIRTLSKSGLFNIQTPQTFVFDQILKAYSLVEGDYNDDSEVYDKAGFTSKIVIGDYDNIKVTTPADLMIPSSSQTKIGIGFDVHKLVKDRPLILGGVNIPHTKGLLGHSDADVLTHSIMDALLSAAGLPDIGVLFPDNNEAYKNANSLKLLAEVNGLIVRRNYKIGNISAVIMAQKPKMAPYITDMRSSLAKVLNINVNQINISATTTEELGIIGNEKGIACSATCMLFS